MTNPQKPYVFGFPSSLKGISFPGKPRILTLEVQAKTVNPGNWTFNGEVFGGLIPGVQQVYQYLGSPPAPTIVNPMSADMIARLLNWQNPFPSYLNSNQTVGQGIHFFDIDNFMLQNPRAKTLPFQTVTASHGSSTPPGPPEITWYIYWTGQGQAVDPQAIINATQNIATQSFLDVTGTLPPTVDPTSPAQVSEYGAEIGGGGSMNFQWQYASQYLLVYGVPLPGGASSAAAALVIIENLEGLGISPGQLASFPWAIASPPPPGSAECTWSIRARTWRRANNFPIGTDAVLDQPTFVTPKKFLIIDPIQDTTVTSGGPNPRACINTVVLNPASMRFGFMQKFF